ncbi:MAG: lytic transglycosylase domain-containing protein [Pseudomonadota bacterium]
MTIDALAPLSLNDREPGAIKRAIGTAARQVGLDFDLLLGVAKRESSLDADAKAATSSASGLFQFIDQTWLGAIKEYGAEIGLGDQAKTIEATANGFTVADPAQREAILDLRFNPSVAAKVAGKTLAAAKDRLTAALGREASGSEVYMAHFLGERGALRMLQASETSAAAEVDPRAAKANTSLFFKDGQALSVAEFKDKLALKIAPDGSQPSASRVPGPYRPRAAAQPVKIDYYSAPAPSSASSLRTVSTALTPQLQAVLLDMQTDTLLGRKD